MHSKFFFDIIQYNMAYQQTILQLGSTTGKYNGRVNIIEEPPKDTWFNLMERTNNRNKATSYVNALQGVWEDTPFSLAYFSAENIRILQNGIRAGVYEKSGKKFIVATPAPEAIKIIMRNIFLQYAEYSVSKPVKDQIQTLNNMVLDYAVPRVYSEAVGYNRYLEDQSTLVQPLELPLHADRVYKQLETKPWV